MYELFVILFLRRVHFNYSKVEFAALKGDEIALSQMRNKPRVLHMVMILINASLDAITCAIMGAITEGIRTGT